MVAPNLVIGVGGTGNAIVTALMHLCAAGLGPRELAIALVDQDAANGGGARTNTTLTAYTTLEATFRQGAADQLPNVTPRLFATESDFIGRMPIDIIPVGQNLIARSLANAGLPTTRDLLTCLFHPNESVPPLDVGFLGHPNVGSVVLRLSNDGGAPALAPLTAYLRNMANIANSGTALRVLIVGSVFGGTGAAGIPALGHMVRAHLTRVGSAATIAACLMTPYFRYPVPGGDDVLAQAALPAGAALGHAKLALPFYQRLLPTGGMAPHVFDCLYLVGNDPPIDVGYFQPGGIGQANPPMFPELLSAVAAAHFLCSTETPTNEVFYTGRTASQEYVWKDIPPVATPGDVQIRMGQLLRWAAAWHYWYGPALDQEGHRRHRRDPWYRQQVGVASHPIVAMLRGRESPLKPSDLAFQSKWRAVNDYVASLLRWAAEIRLMGVGQAKSEVKLLMANAIAEVRGDVLPQQADLRETVDNAGFATLIYAADGKPHNASTLDTVHWQLSEAAADKEARGLGRLVASLYAACAI